MKPDELRLVPDPSVRFVFASLPTRMIVVKLGDGSLWINSPVAVSRETLAMVLTGDGHQAMVDQPLKALGQKRHVALRIPFYIPAILAIAQTDLVLTAVSHQHRWIVVPGHDAELSCRRNLQYRRPAAVW